MTIRSDYLGKAQCNVLKGLFILLILEAHFASYVEMAGGRMIDHCLGHLTTALFMFYSGYGVMESIAGKGMSYVRQMPVRRMATTLLNFDVAVLVFVALNLLLGVRMEIRQILLSLVCWDSVGNSNWYIFSIVGCYAIAWLSAVMFKNGRIGWCALILSGLFIIGLSAVRPTWWYNTILCFPVGMLYSQWRVRIESFCCRHYFKTAVVLAVVFVLCRRLPRYLSFPVSLQNVTFASVMSVAFALLVVMLTMRVRVQASWLEWCGAKLFPIYIYQRLSMIAFYHFDSAGFCFGPGNRRAVFYLFVCLAVTLLIARWYGKWQIKLTSPTRGECERRKY